MVLGLHKTEWSEFALPPRRRYLVLHLPLWASDTYKRRNAALAASPLPFVLYEKQGSALRLAAIDTRASQRGLAIGQSLADARALVPSLVAREIDHDLLAAIFANFADWHSYASPIVAVLADTAPYGDLVLDIKGVEHLFGGEAAMFERVTGRLAELGFTVRAGIADTIGTAWALAHYRPGILPSGPLETLANALSALPVAALRLDAGQVESLHRLGLKQIGQLAGRERKAMAARFGHSLVLRLDQALGLAAETLKPRLPAVEYFTERRYAEPICLIDDVLMTAHDLAVRLSLQLQGKGLGAQAFHLFLYRVDHQVMTFTVHGARATRDPDHIARLFANHAEQLTGEFDAGFGIDMIRLAADNLSDLDAAQVGAFEHRDGAEDLDRLYDRMASRLGTSAVLRLAFVNTHIPERTEVLQSAITAIPGTENVEPGPDRKRPLRLLPQPELIGVAKAEVPDGPPAGMVWRHIPYRFHKVSGPERIGEEWWRNDFKLSTRTFRQPTPEEIAQSNSKELIEEIKRHHIPARDYFIAEDENGHRFWLFREDLYTQTISPNWFLHGLFE